MYHQFLKFLTIKSVLLNENYGQTTLDTPI